MTVRRTTESEYVLENLNILLVDIMALFLIVLYVSILVLKIFLLFSFATYKIHAVVLFQCIA